jgi:hypothetical protein
MLRGPPYWFPAKRYGWGWGFPITWQGWVVFAVYFLALPLGCLFFPPHQRGVEFFVYTQGISLALVFVGWLKGEPTRWRWGK